MCTLLKYTNTNLNRFKNENNALFYTEQCTGLTLLTDCRCVISHIRPRQASSHQPSLILGAAGGPGPTSVNTFPPQQMLIPEQLLHAICCRHVAGKPVPSSSSSWPVTSAHSRSPRSPGFQSLGQVPDTLSHPQCHSLSRIMWATHACAYLYPTPIHPCKPSSIETRTYSCTEHTLQAGRLLLQH